jgi:hypothetical protein
MSGSRFAGKDKRLVGAIPDTYLAKHATEQTHMSETEALFGVLRQSADAGCAAAIERAVTNAPDHELCRVNPLAFAAKKKLDEERTIAALTPGRH